MEVTKIMEHTSELEKFTKFFYPKLEKLKLEHGQQSTMDKVEALIKELHSKGDVIWNKMKTEDPNLKSFMTKAAKRYLWVLNQSRTEYTDETTFFIGEDINGLKYQISISLPHDDLKHDTHVVLAQLCHHLKITQYCVAMPSEMREYEGGSYGECRSSKKKMDLVTLAGESSKSSPLGFLEVKRTNGKLLVKKLTLRSHMTAVGLYQHLFEESEIDYGTKTRTDVIASLFQWLEALVHSKIVTFNDWNC